jgi:hypothetical protein
MAIKLAGVRSGTEANTDGAAAAGYCVIYTSAGQEFYPVEQRSRVIAWNSHFTTALPWGLINGYGSAQSSQPLFTFGISNFSKAFLRINRLSMQLWYETAVPGGSQATLQRYAVEKWYQRRGITTTVAWTDTTQCRGQPKITVDEGHKFQIQTMTAYQQSQMNLGNIAFSTTVLRGSIWEGVMGNVEQSTTQYLRQLHDLPFSPICYLGYGEVMTIRLLATTPNVGGASCTSCGTLELCVVDRPQLF